MQSQSKARGVYYFFLRKCQAMHVVSKTFYFINQPSRRKDQFRKYTGIFYRERKQHLPCAPIFPVVRCKSLVYQIESATITLTRVVSVLCDQNVANSLRKLYGTPSFQSSAAKLHNIQCSYHYQCLRSEVVKIHCYCQR